MLTLQLFDKLLSFCTIITSMINVINSYQLYKRSHILYRKTKFLFDFPHMIFLRSILCYTHFLFYNQFLSHTEFHLDEVCFTKSMQSVDNTSAACTHNRIKVRAIPQCFLVEVYYFRDFLQDILVNVSLCR